MNIKTKVLYKELEPFVLETLHNRAESCEMLVARAKSGEHLYDGVEKLLMNSPLFTLSLPALCYDIWERGRYCPDWQTRRGNYAKNIRRHKRRAWAVTKLARHCIVSIVLWNGLHVQ